MIGFDAILPDEITWHRFDAFPAGVRLAVLIGHPAKAGPYVIRVKVPFGVKIPPHQYPEDRLYTVLSGVFYVGRGDTFESERVAAFPPGSVIILPGNTSYFHFAKSGEYVTQVQRSAYSS
jgi:hypothetical protein